MYHPGQIVWSVEQRKPVRIPDDVWNTKSYPKGRTRPFIDGAGKVVLPKDTKTARMMLDRAQIAFAPVQPGQCWSCDGVHSEVPRDGCSEQSSHLRCSLCNAYEIRDFHKGKPRCSNCYRAWELNGFQLAAEEILRQLPLIRSSNDAASQAVSEQIRLLVQLDDPFHIERNGAIRDVMEEMQRLWQSHHK